MPPAPPLNAGPDTNEPAAATDTFDTLINRLKSLGIAKSVRGQLHAVRDLYNDAKHDPAASVRLKRAVDAISAVRGAVETLIATGIGATAAPIEKVISRLLWVSAYDVYVGGVTEVYVSLPLPEDIFATHLDLVWIDGLAWNSHRPPLTTLKSQDLSRQWTRTHIHPTRAILFVPIRWLPPCR